MEDVAYRARFAAVTTAITRRLPFGLSEVIAPSLVGYLMINLCTFFIDLGLLGLLHGTFRWPIPVAVTLSYGTASVISYTANRVLNFGSHEAVGKQFPVYVVVSASNYLIFVLGLTSLLSHVGVYYELSRVIAACCEGVYLYCMMRWVVFRDAAPAKAGTAKTGPASATAGQAAQAPLPTATAEQAAPSLPPAATAGQAAQPPPPTVTAPPSPPRSG
jgi:putative flippase GtrA